MTKKAIDINVIGIKCDHCDYRKEGVKFEDYPQWLNKPCPKCGANLLTQEDLDSIKMLFSFAELVNAIIPEPENIKVSGFIEMDGTGKMDFKISQCPLFVPRGNNAEKNNCAECVRWDPELQKCREEEKLKLKI